MTGRVALVTGVVAIALAGCGGDDDETTATIPPEDRGAVLVAAFYDQLADLPDEEQIERVGANWAKPFSETDEAMCYYLHPDIAGGCSELASGALTGSVGLQRTFAGATVKSVEVKGGTAVAKFSNGERVEFEKDPSDEWKTTDVVE
jgi:hypothetical protein